MFSGFLHSFLHLSACAWSVSWIIPTSPVGFSYSFILTHSLHLCSLLSGLSIYRRRFLLFPAHAKVIDSVQMMWWKGISRNKDRNYSRSYKMQLFWTLTSSALELFQAGVIKVCPRTFSLSDPQQKNCSIRFSGTASKRARCSQSSKRPRRPGSAALLEKLQRCSRRDVSPGFGSVEDWALRRMVGWVKLFQAGQFRAPGGK